MSNPKPLPDRTKLDHLLPDYDVPEPALDRPTSDDRLEVAVESIQAAILAGGAAAAGMLWATVECLFGSAGDENKLASGERAADVATIAWVRYDLNHTLGALLRNQGDPGWSAAAQVLPRQERLPFFVKYLQAGDFSNVRSARVVSQARHCARMLDLREVGSLRTEVLTTLKGLYRQRNLILHGGITNAPLLPGILRSATPLVTAAVNRYAATRNGAVRDPLAFSFGETLRLEEHLAQPSADLLDLAGY
ncbi:hypothetical protein EKO23_01840 [Nocardioides guangzhouensis]|uniref:Uncharacterized protein n=1 Tax=Nocardioides guangzhouensis TaxID=2497878 RepID=A0A4Q4ZM94_9ACTN|nr:hypothetical protein [Nocardioides guangzhouensis]RYP88656.1 hypothetical protein EKO23_01840 [Nocardioides guangzhouensis]